jgi:integrase
MASVTFVLKNPQAVVKPRDQKETLIFLVLRYGNNRLKLSTGERILPKYWNKVDQEATTNSVFSKDDFNQKLLNKKTLILDIYRRMVNDDEQPTNDRLLKEFSLKDNDRRFNIIKLKGEITLNLYIDQFIKDIKSGERLTPEKKERYKTGTTKNFDGFKVQFDDFQKEKKKVLDFKDITLDFYDDFVGFFSEKKYAPNTIGRHIKNLKTIMRAARDEGLHSNTEIDRKKFKVLKVLTDQIYLTSEELGKIETADLEGKQTLELARDIFLIGCYTAQRFSDYCRIKPEQFRTLANGFKVIDIIQRKTGERVTVPVHWKLEKILEKYDFATPHILEQKLNERIKQVGIKAKITQAVNIEQIRGGLKSSKSIPKHDLIKTHTARRTGATNMYLAGIPSIDIMKITGHKTEKEFLNYIRVSKEETAEMLTNHEYFRSKMKAVNP